MQNSTTGTDAKAYKEQAQQKKQQKIEKLWKEIENNDGLNKHFEELKKKLAGSHKKREETTGLIMGMKEEYNQLKADIKEFLKKQNKIKSVTNTVTSK